MIDVVRILRETTVARVEYHPTIGSTNDRAAQCAARGASELPLLVVADRQTAGRGRDAKHWWTGPGSLAFSLLVDAETVAADESRSPLVALAVAVAVAETAAPLLPSHPVGIHWPNDVYVGISEQIGERKLSGILVEVLPNRRHVIGIGLNMNDVAADAPADLRGKFTTIFDVTGQQHNRTDVLIDLLQRLFDEFARLRSDPKAVADRANRLCMQRDRTLTLQWGERKTVGRCRGVADDGALLLETSAAVEKFYSGSVMRKTSN